MEGGKKSLYQLTCSSNFMHTTAPVPQLQHHSGSSLPTFLIGPTVPGEPRWCRGRYDQTSNFMLQQVHLLDNTVS